MTSGHASSHLHKTTSSTSLELRTNAVGGSGQYGTAESDSVNDAGHARANAFGAGGSSFEAAGGNAEAHAIASAFGDQHDASAAAASTAGSGGWNAPYGPSGLNGRGGDALSEGISTAHGSGASSATANASAGLTGSDLGDGAGHAVANATAIGSLGRVDAVAGAVGGQSFTTGSSTPYDAGLGNATATATGVYLVNAEATASGVGGSVAHSVAHSEGALTAVDISVAAPDATPYGLLHAISEFRAQTTRDQARYQTSHTYNPTAFADAVPFGGTDSWVAGNPTIQGSLDAETRVVAVGLVRSGSGGQVQNDNRHWASTVSFDVDRDKLNFGQDLALGFLDPTVPVSGLDLLQIHISLDGAPVADFSFSNSAAALAGLDDELVTIAAPSGSGEGLAKLVLTFVFSSAGFSGEFLSDFVLIAHTNVPEPNTLLLMAAALGVVILCRRRPV